MRRTPMMAGLVIASMALSANPVAAHPDLGLSEDGLVPIPMPMSNDDIIVIDVAQVDEDFLFVGGVSETGEQVVRHVDLPPFAGPGDPEADVLVNEIPFDPPPGTELVGVEYDPYSDTAVVISNVFPGEGSSFPYLIEVSFDDPMTMVIDLGGEPYLGILDVDFFEGGASSQVSWTATGVSRPACSCRRTANSRPIRSEADRASSRAWWPLLGPTSSLAAP